MIEFRKLGIEIRQKLKNITEDFYLAYVSILLDKKRNSFLNKMSSFLFRQIVYPLLLCLPILKFWALLP